MRATRFLLFFLGPIGLWMSLSQNAQAVPSYSRRYSVDCTRCHSVWGALTPAGQTFKFSGYRAINGVDLKPSVEDLELGKGGKMAIPATLPLSLITGAGYDYREERRKASDGSSNYAKGSSLNIEDASIFLSAPFGPHLSAFIEFPLYETKAWEFTPSGPYQANAKPVGNTIRFNAETPTFEVAKFFWNNLLGDSVPRDTVNLLFGITHLPLAYSPGKVRLPVNQNLIYERRALELLSTKQLDGATGVLGDEANDYLFRLSEPRGQFEIYGIVAPSGGPTEVGKKEVFWADYHLGVANSGNTKSDNTADKLFYTRFAGRWWGQSLGFFGARVANTYDGSIYANGATSGLMSGKALANSHVTFGPDTTLSLAPFDIPLSLDNEVLFNTESNPTGFGQSFSWTGGFHQLNYLANKQTMYYTRYDWIKGNRFNDKLAGGITTVEPYEWDIVLGFQTLLMENVKWVTEYRNHTFTDKASTPYRASGINGRIMSMLDIFC